MPFANAVQMGAIWAKVKRGEISKAQALEFENATPKAKREAFHKEIGRHLKKALKRRMG